MSDALTHIGNATLLVELGPFRVLTDPNFLHRGQLAWLGHGLVSRRRLDPALGLDDLPDLDAVVLSHLHGDHWDRVARRGLDRGLPVLTTPHASRRLQARAGFRRAQGLRPGESTELRKDGRGLRVTAVPGRHAHALPWTALLPPVIGTVWESLDASGAVERRVYVTGDTLYDDALAAVARRWPDLDVAVVHLGGTTLPGGAVVTMDAEQGADLLELVRPRRVVPVHYDDYGVFRSSLGDFRAEVERRGLPVELAVLPRGERSPLAA